VKLMWVVREWRSLYWFYEELLNLRDTKIETTIYITQPSCHVFIDEFNNRFQGLERLEEDSENLDHEKEYSINEVVQVEENSSDEKQDSIKEVAKIEQNSYDEKGGSTHRIVDIIKRELSHVIFKEGRPSIKDIIPQEIHESNGSIAFVTCGHSAMVDEIRYCCAKNVTNPDKKRVDFYEQVQVWA
ncbi:ferric reductase transmembrane component, partial [Candida parapsilosis]